MASTPGATAMDPAPQGYAELVDTGAIVFVAGQIGRPPGSDGASMDFRTEAIRTFESVGTVLGRVGLNLGDVVRCTVYLTDFGDFGDFGIMEDVFRTMFPTSPPARTTVGVSALARDCRIEVEATAARTMPRS